jgi:hypothetical protein
VTAEALFHLLGGHDSGWKPHTVRHEGSVHWFLAKTKPHEFLRWNGDRCRRITTRRIIEILDPTVSQFESPVPYTMARGRGFLTKEPSKRAREMMERLVWQ